MQPVGVCSRSRVLLQLMIVSISIISQLFFFFFFLFFFHFKPVVYEIDLFIFKVDISKTRFQSYIFTQQSMKGLELGMSQIPHYRSLGRAINQTKML